MVKELQSLGLDVKILDKDNEEIDIKQTYDEDDNMPNGSDYYDETDVCRGFRDRGQLHHGKSR